jgi:hypothetical protein
MISLPLIEVRYVFRASAITYLQQEHRASALVRAMCVYVRACLPVLTQSKCKVFTTGFDVYTQRAKRNIRSLWSRKLRADDLRNRK